ncbi:MULTISPECIES: hypothetical protein [unclassified Delftia]|uniref:hypothetical protein n=1 Tax=unclassified Delftia TaxID=2613839 RepID=UPI001902B034|nr:MULTISPECIES: hypothetical protein [unclassified Delftia]MBK0115307.1 hypothetical protein [Delftia sp. S65]MBK0118709.1 hypothetical protein [Delftia sp. S67]MBK0131535.1 hypothetical protein [Delftia sp. S66]
MKAKCCFMALGVGLSTPAFADAGARPANAIERITIRDGTAKSEDPRIHCDSLRIDEKRARYFLRHARPSSQFNYARAYETGSCSARAVVRFKGGRQVNLTIDSGTGWGTTENKRSIAYLYCEECTDLLDPDFAFKEMAAP